jgi:hypothetical protein
MSNELERIWEEPVVTYFKVLSRHFPEGTKENREHYSI